MRVTVDSRSLLLVLKGAVEQADVQAVSQVKAWAVSARAYTERSLTSMRFWFAVGALAAAFLAWDSRHFMNPDGLSYLDMASETLHSGPHNLINLNWSPLYPFLISILLFLFHPSPSLEIPLLHLLNWMIFLTAQLCFAFFLRTWYTQKQDSTARERDVARHEIIVPFGFWLFFWSIIHFIPVSLVTPDLCVAGILFLAAGICGQLSRPDSGWKHHFALGGTLSLGYYAKAAMFPAALLLLLLLFIWPPSVRHGRYRVLAAVVVFFVASLPLVIFMSNRAGRLSISESGAMNYAWWVNKVPPYAGWVRLEMAIVDSLYTGKPGKSVMLTHPPRILIEKPLTLEFSSPVVGTCPLWYDPVYWNEGAKARFKLRQQLGALKENLLKFGHAFTEMSSLCAGAIVLCLFGLPKRMLVKSDRKWSWLLMWPITVGAMYACVHVEYRFLGASFVLFWMAAYGAILGRVDSPLKTAVLATVLCSVVISTIGKGALRHFAENKPPDYLVIAEGLGRLGVRPGDQLATIGTMFDAYYARPAGVRIIAQICDVDEFWSLSTGEFEKVRERLASIGVKALIAKGGPRGFGYGEWQEILGTSSDRVRVLMLQPPLHLTSFPGAQGGGASSVGGRGGAVYEVTNLDDSGSGSLRACINASGPRTCIFRVGGTINLTSGPLEVTNSYLTVAGQTAPGGGIAISAKKINDSVVKIYAHDVIWRYTRLRVGYTANQSKDGFAIIGSAHDIIFDHNSESWATNANLAVWGRAASQYNVTWSWNIIAEPLANHPINMITGADTHELADGMTNLDAHHNLLMNVSHRNPLWKHKSGRWVNNIIYNWAFRATQVGGGIWADLVGNLYKPGPLTPTRIHEVHVYQNYSGNTTTPDGDPSIYIASNQGPSSGPGGDNWNMVYEVTTENGNEIGRLSTRFRRANPLPVAGAAIVADPVVSLESLVLPTVGASQRLDCSGNWVTNRDSADARLINEYNKGKGVIPATENDVAGFPLVAAGSPCTDSDHDGIPDVWESAHGLNPNDPSDGAAVAANGYTNLENYLNGIPPTLRTAGTRERHGEQVTPAAGLARLGQAARRGGAATFRK